MGKIDSHYAWISSARPYWRLTVLDSPQAYIHTLHHQPKISPYVEPPLRVLDKPLRYWCVTCSEGDVTQKSWFVVIVKEYTVHLGFPPWLVFCLEKTRAIYCRSVLPPNAQTCLKSACQENATCDKYYRFWHANKPSEYEKFKARHLPSGENIHAKLKYQCFVFCSLSC